MGSIATCLLAASLAATPAPPPSLLLITLDTVRADHLGPYGARGVSTPTLDRLAAEGVVVDQAIAVAPMTLPSHASLFTGLYPPTHGVRDNADFQLPAREITLAAQLKAHGYQTGAVVGSIVLASTTGIARGFDRFDEPIEPVRGGAAEVRYQEILERRAAEITDRALAQWTTFGTGPVFQWVHYFDAHASYDPPEPFRTRFKAHPYDGEIAYLDAQLGRLIDGLRRSGRLDTTLVVVIADHGESLGEHGEETHGIFIYDATMHVPLLLRWPGALAAGRRYAGLFSGVDLAPTILELLRLPALPHAQGVSHALALRAGSTLPRESIYLETLYPQRAFGWSALRGLRDRTSKFIDAPTPELYDLTTDRAEVNNLAASDPARLAPWRRQLAERVGTFAAPDPAALDPADAERLERLRSLGYVTATSHASSAADPKTMVALATSLERARYLVSTGQAAAAQRLAEAVLINDATNPAAFEVLGLALTLGGAPERGLAALEKAVRAAPTSFEYQRNYGVALLQLDRAADAARALQAACTIQPRSGEARFSLGAALLAAGRSAEALSALREALTLGYTAPAVRAALSSALEASGRIDEAEAELKSALATAPNSVELWLQLGNLQDRLGRREEALASYRRARKAAPDAIDAGYQLARVQLALGDRAAAQKLQQELAVKQPRHPLVRILAAQLAIARGDRAGAIQMLEALASDKTIRAVHRNAAQQLLVKLRGAATSPSPADKRSPTPRP